MENEKAVPALQAYEREKTWLSLAIAMAIIGIVCGGFICLWIAAAPDENAMLTRSRIVTPAGTLFIAAVTFCTVVWRGIVGTRQADEQKRANDAKDEENTANLLIEGTKLLGEKQLSHKVAGIATLQAVTIDRNPKFSISAMDILMDVVSDNYWKPKESNIYLAARRATRAGYEQGQRSSRNVKIEMEKIPNRPIPRILGAAKLTVIGGHMSRMAYERFKAGSNVEFHETKFTLAHLGREASKYRNCTFTRCHVSWIHRDLLAENTFVNCDFSSAEVSVTMRSCPPEALDKLRGGENFYRPGQAPNDVFGIAWAEYLVEKRSRARWRPGLNPDLSLVN